MFHVEHLAGSFSSAVKQSFGYSLLPPRPNKPTAKAYLYNKKLLPILPRQQP
jgi:hypothetical protein